MRVLPNCSRTAGASSRRWKARTPPRWRRSILPPLRLQHRPMHPQHQDMTLAIVSHLPHIIACNIVGTADNLQTVTKSKGKNSASGFRDFTRLAASDPTVRRDVCMHNRGAMLATLARFSEDLACLQRAIR